MNAILTAMQTKFVDQFTINNTPISSIELMEKAGIRCSEKILDLYPNQHDFVVFCGTGNNGGDGLVIARHLLQNGKSVRVFTIGDQKKGSFEFLENAQKTNHQIITQEHDFPKIEASNVIIDAIFGIGLTRPAEGIYASFIQHINQSLAPIVSIDLPSGLPVDLTDQTFTPVINATHTLYIGAPKLTLFLPTTGKFCGELHFIDIDLLHSAYKEIDSKVFLFSTEQAKQIKKTRTTFSHKGTYGHVQIIGGSKGKTGAVILASKAALKAGSGLISVLTSEHGLIPLQSANPEVMVMVQNDFDYLSGSYQLENYTIAIGPGMGTQPETATFFKDFLSKVKNPVVFDADALNLFSNHSDLLSKIPKGSILTPHPKELERLIGKWHSEQEKIELTKSFAQKYDCIVIVKGAYSLSVLPSGVIYVNPSGNPGMATAGSGDTLTGIIVGLLAQGYTSENAACLGVFLHGLAGDLALESESQESLIAADIIQMLGKAFKTLD